MIAAYISSKLEFCILLLSNPLDIWINRLQNLQNACAKYITENRYRDSVSERLQALHCLPVSYRYKLSSRLLCGATSLCRMSYLPLSTWSRNTLFISLPCQAVSIVARVAGWQVSLVVHQPIRFTPSSLGVVLSQVFTHKPDSAGRCALEAVGPSLWGSLPLISCNCLEEVCLLFWISF